jgi:hypothetical protein
MKYLALLLTAFTSQCFAQSTPSEFAEMTFQELFDQSIDEDNINKGLMTPWILSYQLKNVKFKGYLDDTKVLSFDDVLWNGPGEVRTDKNFPVLPTDIHQEAHIITLGYQFSQSWHGHISAPYIKQETDHISIVNNYDFFVINTEGFGDTSVSVSYNWYNAGVGSWRFSFGLSFPTGSITEVGDTPREAGDQQLPYTMQLGSGTYDIPLDLSYQNSGSHNYKVGMSAKIRTGTNNRDYRLGNNFRLYGRYKIELSSKLQTYAGLTYQYSDNIHGQDDSLLVNSPFPYPAGITNPQLYGGKKINARLGLVWQLSKGYQLNVEIGKPVYQYLNGPQPKEHWNTAISISKTM